MRNTLVFVFSFLFLFVYLMPNGFPSGTSERPETQTPPTRFWFPVVSIGSLIVDLFKSTEDTSSSEMPLVPNDARSLIETGRRSEEQAKKGAHCLTIPPETSTLRFLSLLGVLLN